MSQHTQFGSQVQKKFEIGKNLKFLYNFCPAFEGAFFLLKLKNPKKSAEKKTKKNRSTSKKIEIYRNNQAIIF